MATLESRIERLKQAAPITAAVSDHFKGIEPDALQRLLRLHDVGAEAFMLADWLPKQCEGYKPSADNIKYRAVIEHKLQKLVSAGKCFVCHKSALSAASLAYVHVSKIKLAPKEGDETDRLCCNATTSCDDRVALNPGIDVEQSDGIYPKAYNPTIRDLAENACALVDAYPGEELGGATIDVSAAFQQKLQHTL